MTRDQAERRHADELVKLEHAIQMYEALLQGAKDALQTHITSKDNILFYYEALP